MDNLTVPIQVNLPDNWVELVVDRLRNDPEAEWIEVTRCKECVYWEQTMNDKGVCKDMYGFGRWWKEDDYCSHAERRGE